MNYKNAAEILPQHLLEEIQKYASGQLMYIPANENKAAWGGKNGSRQKYDTRNREIVSLKNSGSSIKQIAEMFYLSTDSIKKILNSNIG